MKKGFGILFPLLSMLLLLWIEQGIGVTYIWKTVAKVILFLLIPLILFRAARFPFLRLRQTDRTSIKRAVFAGLAVMGSINDLIRSEKKELMVEEVILEEDSPLIGKTVEQVNIRKTFGITLVAIMRNGKLISNPDFEEVFRNNDTLIAIGDPEGVEKLRKELGIEVDQ